MIRSLLRITVIFLLVPAASFAADGGHPMHFQPFAGRPMLALNQPNPPSHERERVRAIDGATDAPASRSAPKPLFRDPVYDGAADPVVIWNPHVRRWWMFYTNRRANVPGLSGVAWVHGTKIGIAASADAGRTWNYVGTAEIDLPPALGSAQPTEWAPDIVTAPDGSHHLFLTVVPGIFENWEHPRTIVHLISGDLRHWHDAVPLKLASDRVIDPCVHRLPDGTWRLWYNNERDHKSIYYADSADLVTWVDRGKCSGVGERPGEGPYVFEWKGRAWMLVDLWHGLGVYSSPDFLHWTAQPENLLGVPGHGADDGVNGGHPGVVVSGGRAFCFYFTHPGRAGTISPHDRDALALRRSSIQVVELHEHDGRLSCDRDAPTFIQLLPPK
ncbi:MAG TPA: glycosyl hydrolase [Opitutus sp.]|nr:glycosyl hydrolase [Opitutus sp.]